MPTWKISCSCGEGILYTAVEGRGRFRMCQREGQCEEERRHLDTEGTEFRDPFQCSKLRAAFEDPKHMVKLRPDSVALESESVALQTDRVVLPSPILHSKPRREALRAGREVTRNGGMNHSVTPNAVRSAIEQTIDTRWPGAYLGTDMEDGATNAHCFVMRADDRQYRLIVSDRVREAGDIQGAIGAIRTHAELWIQLIKDRGSVLFTMDSGQRYAFKPCRDLFPDENWISSRSDELEASHEPLG